MPTATECAVTGQGGEVVLPRKSALNTPESLLTRYLGGSAKQAESLQRGPLEALAGAIDTQDATAVFRADFVTLDGERLADQAVPALSEQETNSLVEAMQPVLAPQGMTLHPLRPGVAAVVVRGHTIESMPTVCPFHIPVPDGGEVWGAIRNRRWLRQWVDASREVLASHPVNAVRVDLGENPANALWPWGGGAPIAPAAERDRFPRGGGVMVTQSQMAQGLAKYAGMDMVRLADPWGQRLGKRASFKIAGLVEGLQRQDHVVVYVEAPWPGGRYGGPTDKVWALENLDHTVLAPLRTVLEAHRPYRLLLTVDGGVSVMEGTRLGERCPMILTGAHVEPDAVGHWDEVACAAGQLGAVPADELMDILRKD